jgi:hypothetical protein
MAIILKANKFNLFVSSVLFVFWYHSPNFLDTTCDLMYYTQFKAVEASRSQWPVVQTHMTCPVTRKVQQKLALFSGPLYRYFSVYAVAEFQK